MIVELAGARVCYGTGSGRPSVESQTIVFVHGAGFDHSVWVMPARYFARHGYRVIAPDLPGHGRSDGPALESIEQMADWLHQLVSAVVSADQTQGIALVGHSMGTLVAMAYASRFPDATRALALLGTSSPMPVGAPLLAAARDNHHAAYEMANTWSHSTQGRLGSSQNPGVNNFVSGERWLERLATDVYFADLAACNAYQPSAPHGDLPTLVIAGTDDKMTPVSAGQAVADAWLAKQTVVLPGCGHAMLSEQPNQVLDALAQFVPSATAGNK